MKARLGIKSPMAGKPLPDLRFFVAYGYGKGTGPNISGVLLSAQGDFITKSVKTIVSDKLWVLTFKPAKGTVNTTDAYTLVVYDLGTGAAAAVYPVRFSGVLHKRDDSHIHIIGPGDGDNVCEKFAIYGTTDQPQYVISYGVFLQALEGKGKCSPERKGFYGGTVTPDPDGTWVGTLQAAASQVFTYKVEASDTNGGYSERDNLTVSDCADITN